MVRAVHGDTIPRLVLLKNSQRLHFRCQLPKSCRLVCKRLANDNENTPHLSNYTLIDRESPQAKDEKHFSTLIKLSSRRARQTNSNAINIMAKGDLKKEILLSSGRKRESCLQA